MAPRGEIAITLTAEEVQALKEELQDLCAGSRSPRANTLNAILEKLRMAEEKML